jgi:predicted extracellular nuclease
MKSIKIISFFFFILIYAACSTTEKVPETTTQPEAIRMMFYNVENLFDTEDDSLVKDEEFLPEGDKHWDNYKYFEKLKHISKVVLNTGWDVPALIGICEVENRGVLEDLVHKTPLVKFEYQIIHEESPDRRGIDVGLLYRKGVFKPVYHKAIPIHFPDKPDYKTRDILYAKGTIGKDTLHIFVNHWPSRWGGQAASEPRRVFVASVLRHYVDSLFQVSPKTKIIITGDFNDGPDNKSINTILKAAGNPDGLSEPFLFNFMYSMKKQGKGSHKYKTEWNTLDQFVVSSGLLADTLGLHVTLQSASIMDDDFLMEKDPFNPGEKPFRTYAGPRYLGGYSDHLPILLEMRFR